MRQLMVARAGDEEFRRRVRTVPPMKPVAPVRRTCGGVVVDIYSASRFLDEKVVATGILP
jgi:hypothetical protein